MDATKLVPGTACADREPPPFHEVEPFLITARIMIPNTPPRPGCLRPLGPHRSDRGGVAAARGANRIVEPARLPSGKC